jgi:hypothetical protein
VCQLRCAVHWVEWKAWRAVAPACVGFGLHAGAAMCDAGATRPNATRPSGPELASASPRDLFYDPAGGAFDVSGFLSTRAGFLPVVVPITEPAVGCGPHLG